MHETAKSARGAGTRVAAVRALDDELEFGDPLRHHEGLDRRIVDIGDAVESLRLLANRGLTEEADRRGREQQRDGS
ncbi:MAG TPA: hypothetical protein VFY87_20785 [Geminicoccaceae bacterium]|nr:hypothetical protein [Geminicoccaceae bacterium]